MPQKNNYSLLTIVIFFMLKRTRTGGTEKCDLWKHFSRRGVIAADKKSENSNSTFNRQLKV